MGSCIEGDKASDKLHVCIANGQIYRKAFDDLSLFAKPSRDFERRLKPGFFSPPSNRAQTIFLVPKANSNFYPPVLFLSAAEHTQA